MSRRRELQRQLGKRYSYEQRLSDRQLQRLRLRPPAEFTETVAACLTVGCVRLHAVLYRSYSSLLLGYDVFVKDDPSANEWIFFDSLSDPVSLKETEMLLVLDRFTVAQGLSYTESCFARLEGKTPEKAGPSVAAP